MTSQPTVSMSRRESLSLQFEYEDLKIKLTETEIENLKLKRRLSIIMTESYNGVDNNNNNNSAKIPICEPNITMAQVSNFMKRLPSKHKQKLWEKYAVDNNYVPIDNMCTLLHSFIALCIKVQERDAQPPKKEAILDKLLPYQTLI